MRGVLGWGGHDPILIFCHIISPPQTLHGLSRSRPHQDEHYKGQNSVIKEREFVCFSRAWGKVGCRA